MCWNDDHGSGHFMEALRQLHGERASPDLVARLQALFSTFGDVRRVSDLGGSELDRMFLIDFHREVHATRAANATGFKLFGITTLIVNLAKLSSA